MRRKGYSVVAAGAAAEIFIYGPIGASFFGDGVTDREVARDLLELKGKDVVVRINSEGGDVQTALGIYNSLRRHKGTVTTQVDGFALSAAGVIYMAGETKRMADTSFVMIHRPMGGSFGTAEEMRKMAEVLDALAGKMENLYSDATGNDVETIRTWMEDTTWFSPSPEADGSVLDALEFNFVDEVTEELQVAAAFDTSRYEHVPARAAAMISGPPASKPKPQRRTTLSISQSKTQATIARVKRDHAELMDRQERLERIGAGRGSPDPDGRILH